MDTAAQSSSSGKSRNKARARGRSIATYVSSLCLLIIALLVCTFWSGSEMQSLELSEFTYVGRDADGSPRGIIDVDAIISKLRLPSPSDERVRIEDYPDLYALCTMSLSLSYTEDENVMHVTVSCDTETLKQYGIIVGPLQWDQQIKGAVIEEPSSVIPSPRPTAAPEPDMPENTEQPTMVAGILKSLVDNRGNGLNLRDVCQRVHDERDFLCKEIFGNNYSTTKTQVYFIVDTQEEKYVNLYHAVYEATEKVEEGVEPESVFFTVDLYNLEWTEEGKVTYGWTDVNIFNSLEDASSAKRFSGEQYIVQRLYDGGVVVKDKNIFDQNGFVRFAGRPTSYLMANGIMWSPSYDELTEDMIWGLTAVQGHSLANVLRYVRKEINARYYMPFSENTEAEFFNHFGQYSWYEVKEPSWEDRMTETEKANIKLLREIQSLVEN